MAEVVAEMQERLLPVYEQLKKFEVCTDEQIRECIRKRKRYQMRIAQSEKIQDYRDFIIFELKIHKLVTEKEKIHGTQLAGLRASIANRIIRLYRDGLLQFPHVESFWISYIKFSKASAPHEVSGIYEKMLTYHGDNPTIWHDAALWAFQYSMNMDKVNKIFFRSLQRHPDSEIINKAFFDMLLIEAAKKSPEKNLSNNTVSEQDIALERVEVIYQNSRKKISNVKYFLSLLEQCEENRFLHMTAQLQKMILDDLMKTFPREECLWDALAQRELRGLSMSDLQNLSKRENCTKAIAMTVAPLTATSSAASTRSDTLESMEQDIKDPSLRDIWQERTPKRRIELCCRVYDAAVQTLQTQEMWTLYINAMLKLNQDLSTQQVLKRTRLAIAMKGGHESGLMNEDHYYTFIHMLLKSPNGIEVAESILSEAVKRQKSLKLYEIWISTYIVHNNEAKVYEIFRKASSELGAQAVPIWQLTLQFYKTRYDDCAKRLQKLYKEACQQTSPEFGVFRSEYLEFVILNYSMQKTREEYDRLCQLPPACLELHQKMALLESHVCVKSQSDLDRWRLCHENATHYFGKTHSEVWTDFIKFERDNGDPKRMSDLNQRAKNTLDKKLVDNFISEYTLLTAVI